MTITEFVNNLSEPVKHVADVGAIGIAAATLLAWLPGIAAILSVVWLAMRIIIAGFELRKWWRGDV